MPRCVRCDCTPPSKGWRYPTRKEAPRAGVSRSSCRRTNTTWPD
jgi:hypothetical protein